jgi:hypothetical protein
MIRSLPTATALLVLAAAAPVAAQDEDTAVNLVYITDDEECPVSTEEVITVCGVLEEQYRIPRALRHSEDPENTAWAERVSEFRHVGDTGINSCSPVGPGGATGCTQELIRKAYADRANSAEARFGQAIAEAREERLSTIDVDTRLEQERVEQIEREYMERLERERQAPLPGDAGSESEPDALPPPEAANSLPPPPG